MIKRISTGALLSFGIFCLISAQQQPLTVDFYAYHTKVSHTSTDYVGKYADLIVVLGEGRQLEFTRRTNYIPRWVTPLGIYLMDEFFPERDPDYNLEYCYVRLLEEGPDKIVVHRRYVPDIKMMEEANSRLDPLFIGGFTNVVHETYTIYPTGRVERLVKDARDTKYYTWIKEDFAHAQTLELKEDGITYGPVNWGNNVRQLPGPVEKNPVVSRNELPEAVISFTFDEGGRDFMNKESEVLFGRNAKRTARGLWQIPDPVLDGVNRRIVGVSGHGALFKKGVSGTSLAFDGYYTGIHYDNDPSYASGGFSLEAWLALDTYPFNLAPLVHQSKKFGEEGFYLGIDPYGKPFITVNGSTATASEAIPLSRWTHLAATIDNQNASLYVNAEKVTETSFTGKLDLNGIPLSIGMNTEKEYCTDRVRGHERNLPFVYGIEGLLDEVHVYDKALSGKELDHCFTAFLPNETLSELRPGVLPGETGVADQFGATYKTLSFDELWDRMWRLTDKADLVVKFDNSPASVVYWHGNNYGAGWVTDNNRWMADQSSEIGGKYGCSEHMADKQCRHSYVRVIENNEARVVIHWRHPTVDISYRLNHRRNWADEYHTIYPDGTAVRKVEFNNLFSPGFQDIQYLTNPRETALDVMHMNAMTVANTAGETQELRWEKPNQIPEILLQDATIEWLNSRSEYKVFAVFPGPGMTPWGGQEQSAYTDDPFAGPWNHWPVGLAPSDGRYAVAHDRVTSFAIAAHDHLPQLGSVMLYGFTKKKADAVVPVARAWKNPPQPGSVSGARYLGYNRDEKAFEFQSEGTGELSFAMKAERDSPLMNPCFVIYNSSRVDPVVKVNGKTLTPGRDLRTGQSYDTEGRCKTIVWLDYESDNKTNVNILF
jgi:hypothetical protein